MEKAKLKKEQRTHRRVEQEKKQRTRRMLVWSLSIGFAVLIAALAVFWPKPRALDLAYDNIPTVGPAGAKVKITEFGDFKCPACAHFSQNVMPKIKAEFIDTGKASLSYQNFLIISPQQDSLTAALAGQAVYHQSNEEFWKFYDAVYRNQQPEQLTWATSEHLVDLAMKAGLKIDFGKLKQDIDNQTYLDEIKSQQRFAVKKGYSSTPTVLINGVMIDADTALNYDKFKAEIEKTLQQAGG